MCKNKLYRITAQVQSRAGIADHLGCAGSARPSAMSNNLAKTATGWGQSGWKVAQGKRAWGFWSAAAEREPECTQGAKKAASGILAWIGNVDSRSRAGIVPS